jgi:hypothetical protein
MTGDHDRNSTEQRQRFLEAVSKALDDMGDAADSAESRQRVADAVATNAEARRWYIEAMLLEADLADAHAGTGVGDVVDLLAHAPGGDVRQWRRWRLAAALTMVISLLGGLGGTVAWQAIASMQQAAALGQISNTRLAMPPTGSNAESVAVGRLLARERLTLDSGGIEITLRSGGVLVVEGPAELDLLTDHAAFLHRGSMVMRQPESGRQCVVETPAATVTIDRGECGIAVTEALVTEVQNYTGRAVVSRDIARFPLRLDAETAVRIVPGDAPSDETLAFDAGRFLRRLPSSPGVPRPATPGTEGFYRSFGRPQVEAMPIPRTNEPVMIDGQLDEWPAEPAFRATRSADGSGPEWLEAWMLYDASGLYVAARVGDPHPLRNAVDPETRLETLWHGGALQLFLSLDRGLGWPAEGKAPAYYNCRHLRPPLAEEVKATNPRLLTLFLWHHAPSGTDRLALASALGTDAAEVTDGFAGRFVPAANGRGYVLEYRISWETLGVADDPPQPGDHLATCWELHFSDETGRLWRDQIIEVRSPREPPALYPFESAATWGRAEFQ